MSKAEKNEAVETVAVELNSKELPSVTDSHIMGLAAIACEIVGFDTKTMKPVTVTAKRDREATAQLIARGINNPFLAKVLAVAIAQGYNVRKLVSLVADEKRVFSSEKALREYIATRANTDTLDTGYSFSVTK